MSCHITGFDLPLPTEWHWMPPVHQAPPGWQTPMAESLIPPELRSQESVSALVKQLGDVYHTVTQLDVEGVYTAVRSSAVLAGQLIGMMVLVQHTDTKLDDITQEIAQITQGDEETTFQSVDRFGAVIPAGNVSGAHVIMGTPAVDEFGQAIHVLEERIMLGIGTDGCDDVMEITFMSSSLNSFPNMTEYVLGLLQHLTIRF